MELENYFHHYPIYKMDDFLFKPKSNKQRFTNNSLTHRFKEFYIGASLSNCSSHTGRRTFITKLASKGVGIKVLMKLANHTHITTTNRYIDVSDDMKRNAVELL